jgi:hypothetical protein
VSWIERDAFRRDGHLGIRIDLIDVLVVVVERAPRGAALFMRRRCG